MRKIIIIVLLFITLGIAGYFTFLYTAAYSEGFRSGELIKFSSKGVAFKTWEGELSQGIAGAQIFAFSVLDSDQNIVDSLNAYQGKYVKIKYVEKYKTFPWWGDTKYYVTEVLKEDSPFKIK